MDSNGYVFWYLDNNAFSNIDFKYFPEDSVFTFARSASGNAYFHILDLNMNEIGMLSHTNDVDGDAHDIQILPNGHYIIGCLKDSVMDLSGFNFSGTPGSATTNVNACVIQEFDESFNLVFEWNSLNHIHPTECVDSIYGYNPLNFDYCHFNAIEQDDDGNFLLSFRHLDAIYKIDRTSGNVKWILGGKSNQFTFVNDNGFSGQHDIRKLPNGNYSLFDNANSSPIPRKSRGVEFALDTINMTATKTWEYIHTPSFFANAMGNHVTSENEDHLLGYGLVYRPNPNAVIVDDGGNVSTLLMYTDSVMSYRTHWQQIPFPFQQPEISCSNTGSGILLSAPPGFTNYVWNTGETTSSILVNIPGTYLVWVNQGEGMLGSQPVILNNINLDCISSVFDEEPTSYQSNIKYVDLLGREVKYPIEGNFYIKFNNGKGTLTYISK